MATTNNSAAQAGTATKKRGQFKETWRRLKKNRMAMIGLTVVVFLVLISIFADVLFDYDTVVIKQNTQIRLQGPSAEHWLGTDEFGRDILARLVHGSRVSLSVGVVAVSISLVLGGSLGAAAGFYGGTIDNVIMRFMDILLAVPSLLLSITIVSALGPSIINLMLAIAISSLPGYARIVRASVLTVKDQEFVEAAKCIGANNFEIILSHIIPNCMAPIIVQVSLKVASAILSTSGLSFLGLGIQACGHGHKRFLDLIHFGGLQQKPGDTQTNCLLGIGKVLIAGQHRHLHVRELTAQRRQHGQAVGSGHADVGEQDMGLQFPDQRRAFLGAAGRSHDLAAVVRPLDDPPQAFHNDIFIVNENYPIHRIRSFFFLPGHAAPA